MTREERLDRARSARRTFSGWTPPPKPKPDRHGIGGNNPPRYDPDMPVTGFPRVLRDAKPVSLDGKTELTSRSAIRAYEREHGVERVGLEYTGSEKPAWWDDYKDNRREREKAAATGKAAPPKYLPSEHQTKKVRNADL